MTTQPGTSPLLVNTPKTFAQMLAHLHQQHILALDTESDSLYSYFPKICLIQLSAPAHVDDPNPLAVVDFLVDPLRLGDLAPLGELFSSPQVEVIMHASENDMLLLYRNFGFTFGCVFDTQLAARILGWKQVGLAAILENQFGIVSDKRMQRTNWGKRPLTPQQIAYAQMDTHYLLALREKLITELKGRHRWEEAQDAFAHLAQIDYAQRQTEERTFWNMKSTREVPLTQLGVLETLWRWREDEARRQDRPPFKVVTDQILIEVAKTLPGDRAALGQVPGLSDNQDERYGAALLRAVQEGRTHPQPRFPEAELRPENALDRPGLARYDALRKWRSEKATVRDVAPDIVLPNSTLLAIALRNPTSEVDLLTIPDLGPWKVRTYGAEILATLHGRQP